MLRAGRSRTFVIVLIAVVVILGVVIAMLPAIASATVAPGIVEGLVEKQVNGSATVDSVTLRWSGPHSIEGLHIRDAGGTEVGNLDVHLKTSFLKLALSRVDSYDVTISGTLDGTLHDDGTVSFTDLLRSTTQDNSASDEDESNSAPIQLQGFVPVHIALMDMKVQLEDQMRGDTMSISVDTGEVSIAAGQPIDIALNGSATRGATTGSFTMAATCSGLIQADGTVTPGGAAVQGKLVGNALPLPGTAQIDQLQRININTISRDLASSLEVQGQIDLQLADVADSSMNQSHDDHSASRLALDLSVLSPVNEQLQVKIGPASIIGEVDARNIPADLLQIVLANVADDLPIVVSRDVGRSVNVELAADTDAPRTVTLALYGDHAAVDITARLDVPDDPAAIAASAFDVISLGLRATVHPDLLSALTDSAWTIDQPTPLVVNASNVHVPAADSDGTRRLNSVSGNVTVILQQPFTLLSTARDRPVHIDGLQLSAVTEGLADEITLFGRGLINHGELSIDQRIAGVVSSAGTLQSDWRALDFDGEIQLQGMSNDLVRSLLVDLPPAMQQQLDGLVDIALTTSTTDDGIVNGEFFSQAGQITIRATAARSPDAVRVKTASVRTRVEPELLQSLQRESDSPITIDTVLPVTLTLADDVEFPFSEAGGIEMPSGPVFLSVDTDRSLRLLNVPALVEPLELRDTSINVIAGFDRGDVHSLDVVASALWHTQSTDRTVGDLIFEATLPVGARSESSSAVSEIRVSLERLAVRRLERALGRDVDSIARWIGSRGNLHLVAQPNAATDVTTGSFDAQFTQLAGAFEFELSADDVMTISGRTSDMTITSAALNDWLRMQPGSGTTVIADVPGSFDMTTLRFPMALLQGEPVDPDVVQADIDINAGPMTVRTAEGVETTLTGLNSSVDVASLNQPVRFVLKGAVPGAADAESGTINIDGSVRNLLDADRRFNAAGATVDMTVTGSSLPVAIADALGAYNGLLVAAIGSTANADLVASQFSTDTGNLDGTVGTEQGNMNVHLTGREGLLHVVEDKPITAELELTPEFRERVLKPIHPLFADIRSMEHPIRATVTNAEVPVNGDVGSLNADIQIVVGKVQYTTSSLFVRLLKLFNEQRDTVPGRIDPISVHIRDGVVTYDRFAAIVDKFTFEFAGQVDLNTRMIDLRFDMPGESLAKSFHDLEGYVDGLIIPLRCRGPIDNYKIEIDPDYDITAEAAKAGLTGVIEKELDDEWGNLIKDILNPGGGEKKPKSDGGKKSSGGS